MLMAWHEWLDGQEAVHEPDVVSAQSISFEWILLTLMSTLSRTA